MTYQGVSLILTFLFMFDFVTPAPETEEAKALAELTQIDKLSDNALNMFIQQSIIAWRRFWLIGTPPEGKIVQAGTNALKMFQTSGAVQAFIKSLRPDYVELGIPDEYIPVFKEDGSATLTKKEVVPEEIQEVTESTEIQEVTE